MAGCRPDGKIHVGIIPATRGGQSATLPGVEWIPVRMKQLDDSWRPSAWVIDDRSAAGSLLPEIARLGVEVGNASAADVARACMAMHSKVLEDNIRHRGAKPLSDSVTAGKMRDLADVTITVLR